MGRRKAREIALQLLYQFEMNDIDLEKGLVLYWDNYRHPPAVRSFADFLVRGTRTNQPHIDTVIAKTAKNWSFERISPVDRNILRLAVYEMLFCEDIPYKVTVNEAIELGKKFASEKSSAFINGILDNIFAQNPDLHKQASV